MLRIRTFVLYAAIAVHTFTIGLLALLVCVFLPKRWQMKVLISCWTKFIIVYIRVLGGITYEVTGLEHIKNGNGGVILSQHQSVLEPTLYQDMLYPALHVAKESLRKVPVFGWGLTMIGTVYINRSKKSDAKATIYEQGRKKVENGCWLVIYPEGTRVEPGQRLEYKLGAAKAAIEYGCKLYPIAHNAGQFCNRKGIVQTGCVQFVIGEGMDAVGQDPVELTQRARDWIEAQDLS